MRTALADLLSARAIGCCRGGRRERPPARARRKTRLILLDIMMPKLDGFALCAELRRLSNAVRCSCSPPRADRGPRGRTGRRRGHYLVKPFSTEELLAGARAAAAFQRQHKTAKKLKLGEIEIDLARQTAVRGKRPVHLTAKEFAMLRLMAEAEGEPVTRERFLDVVWATRRFQRRARGQSHCQPARQAGTGPGRTALAQDDAWRGIQTGVGRK